MGMFGFDDQSLMFDVTPVQNQFILEHMLSAQGDYVKVYLYGLLHCYRPSQDMSVKQMADDLLMTTEDVLKAYRYWERRGLVVRVTDEPPAFRYVNVKQHAMLGVNAKADPGYEAFAESVYALFGDRRIHGSQLTLCYEWVEDLGLPPEVVILLLQHMMHQRGKGFSIKTASKLAAQLADENARTIDDAEQVLSRDTIVWEGCRKVLRRMGKRRMPTEDEAALYLKWYREWRFGPQAIEAACAEMTKGDPSFAYLDGILRGIKGRSGAKSSAAALEMSLQAQKDRAEPLKQLLSALGARDLKVNDGTLKVYDSLRAMYDEEVILLAAQQCAPRGGKLDDVYSLLDSWQKRGLKNAAQVKEHISRVKQQDAFLRRLYEQWGLQIKPGAADRKLAEAWMGELGMTEAFILHCAPWASGSGKPMTYMDAILRDLAQRGIRTEDAADMDHAARRQARQNGSGASGQPRVLREQQYEQREYEPSAGIPDWMKQMLDEEAAKDDAE